MTKKNVKKWGGGDKRKTTRLFLVQSYKYFLAVHECFSDFFMLKFSVSYVTYRFSGKIMKKSCKRFMNCNENVVTLQRKFK
jgi:hypothetical protein